MLYELLAVWRHNAGSRRYGNVQKLIRAVSGEKYPPGKVGCNQRCKSGRKILAKMATASRRTLMDRAFELQATAEKPRRQSASYPQYAQVCRLRTSACLEIVHGVTSQRLCVLLGILTVAT